MMASHLHPSDIAEVCLSISFHVMLSYSSSAISVTPDSKQWYSSKLKKPAWCPGPTFLFPLWSALFTLLGIAFWLVVREGGPVAQQGPLGLYLAVLVLLVAWGPIFLRARRLNLALIDACALMLMEVFCFHEFYQVIGMTATLLLLGPLLVWTFLGCILNYSIVQRNPMKRSDTHEVLAALASDGNP